MEKAGSYFVAPVPESAVVNPAEMIATGDGVRGWNETYEDGVGLAIRRSRVLIDSDSDCGGLCSVCCRQGNLVCSSSGQAPVKKATASGVTRDARTRIERLPKRPLSCQHHLQQPRPTHCA